MLDYNQEDFEKWRTRAITDMKQLAVGKTYYTNLHSKRFTIDKIDTVAELFISRGSPAYRGDDEKFVFYFTKEDGNKSYAHCADFNVGASYNPWLIFESEIDAVQCRDRLKITDCLGRILV